MTASTATAILCDSAGRDVGDTGTTGNGWMSRETLEMFRANATAAGDTDSAAEFDAELAGRKPGHTLTVPASAVDMDQRTGDGVKTTPDPLSGDEAGDADPLTVCLMLYDRLNSMNLAAVKLAAQGKPDAARLMADWLPVRLWTR